MKVGGVIGGKYRLSRIIGKGAMGTVWAASNELTSREVAIKLIGDSTQDLRIRLMREAKACGSLSHRNIIEVLDVGLTDTGDPFLVMPLLQGETLAEHLERNRRVTPTAAARIARDIARALSYAHRAGIVHRDLKPANIFLHHEPGSEDFVVKVLDFGVSKNLYNREAVATVAGGAIGSPAYMSPEQINPAGTVDFLSDIWSLGVVFFEMLTGQRPFQGDSVHVLTQVTIGDIPRVSKHLWRIEPALDELVARCMERERNRRIQSAEEVIKALDAYLANETSQITVASPLSENPPSENLGLKGTIAMDNAPPDVMAARKSMRKNDSRPSLPAVTAEAEAPPSDEGDEDIQTVPVNSVLLAHLNFSARPAAVPAKTSPAPSAASTAPAASSPPPAPLAASEDGTHLMSVPSRTPTSPPFINSGATIPLQAHHLSDPARPAFPATETPKPVTRPVAAPSFGPPPPPAPQSQQSNQIQNTNDSTIQLTPAYPTGTYPAAPAPAYPTGGYPAAPTPAYPTGGYPAAPTPAYSTLTPPSGYPSTPTPGERLSTTSASGALHIPTSNPYPPYSGQEHHDEEDNALRKRGQRLMIMVGVFSAMVVTTIVLLLIPAFNDQPSGPDEPVSSADVPTLFTSAAPNVPTATTPAPTAPSAAPPTTSTPTATVSSLRTPSPPPLSPPTTSTRPPQVPPQPSTKSSNSKPAPAPTNKTKTTSPMAPFPIDWDNPQSKKSPKPSTTKR